MKNIFMKIRNLKDGTSQLLISFVQWIFRIFISLLYGSVSRKTHFSRSFPGPLIVHGLPVSCPFNFPNGNLKQQLSHIGVFICYQNIDAKNKLNLHIYGIHLLNPDKTVVSHLKY